MKISKKKHTFEVFEQTMKSITTNDDLTTKSIETVNEFFTGFMNATVS